EGGFKAHFFIMAAISKFANCEHGQIKKMLPESSLAACWQRCIYCNCVYSHGRLVGCVGGVGGVIQGTLTKSKNSLMSICAASRLVRLGKPKRVSINFAMAV